MVYETFQETIRAMLQEKLGAGYCLDLQQVPKNNGLVLDGLAIRRQGQSAAPMIYLEPYYERFLGGLSIDALAEEIMDICRENSGILRRDFSMLRDFSQLRERVVYRLINTRANRLLLENMPSVPFQDLSIVFCLMLEQGPFGQMTAPICRRHLPVWGTDDDELYALARRNTPVLLPPELRSISQVMDDIAREHMGERYRPDIIDDLLPEHKEAHLYTLSNTAGLNGACAVLYPGVLKKFADQLDQDLVILPSSIHEVLLLPHTRETTFSALSDMVASINQREVALEDRLSDHVYFYSRLTDEIVIARDAAPARAS